MVSAIEAIEDHALVGDPHAGAPVAAAAPSSDVTMTGSRVTTPGPPVSRRCPRPDRPLPTGRVPG